MSSLHNRNEKITRLWTEIRDGPIEFKLIPLHNFSNWLKRYQKKQRFLHKK